MRRFLFHFLVAITLSGANLCSGQEWADLEITFLYGGVNLPQRNDIKIAGGVVIPNEKLLVNPTNRGIQNCLLWLDAKKSELPESEIHPTRLEVDPKRQELDLRALRISPHVLVMRAGQTLEIKNWDPVGYALNFNFFNNQAVNVSIPPGAGMTEHSVLKAEPGEIPVDCNIHPWVRAYLLVLDHPYAAVSDVDGRLQIKRLPAGKTLFFRIWHEGATGIKEIELDGKKWGLSRNRLEFNLVPGVTKISAVIGPGPFGNR